jgi:hypothetical protein
VGIAWLNTPRLDIDYIGAARKLVLKSLLVLELSKQKIKQRAKLLADGSWLIGLVIRDLCDFWFFNSLIPNRHVGCHSNEIHHPSAIVRKSTK